MKRLAVCGNVGSAFPRLQAKEKDMSKLDRRDFMKKTVFTGTAAVALLASETAGAQCLYNKTVSATRIVPRLKDVARWDLEDFEPLVGTPFEIADRMMTLEKIRKGPETPAEFRKQFSLLFDVGKVDGLESGIMPVRHPRLGKVDVFVNIVGYSDAEPAAEIYFS